MILYDAHNHLHAAALAPCLDAIVASRVATGMVVNGTNEEDWAAVARLAAGNAWIRPSYGVHPWEVDAASPEWRERLCERLDEGGFVGEIGLDRWRTDRNFARQMEIFRWQLDQAARRNVPATIHCLRAWGALAETLAGVDAPERGFLIHAYGGPVEMLKTFAARGAYFSFSATFLAAGRERKREAFRVIPEDRLLVETDAPSMALPPELDRHPLPPGADGERVNHPDNLAVAYEGLARLRGMPLDALAGVVAENYERLFGA
jgi:TatD DNase family protein